MDFRDLYKNRRIPTLSATFAKHYQDIITCRQEKQREFFWSKRGQAEVEPPKTEAFENKKRMRMEMFKKWKEEKLKKREEEKKKCRPIFKVGVVQKKITGSPLIIEKKKCKNDFQKKDEKVVKSQLRINEKYSEGIVTRSKSKIQGTLGETQNKDKKQLNAVKKGEQKPKPNLKLNNKFCKVETGKLKKVNSLDFKVPKEVAALPYSNKLTFPDSPNITKKKNLPSVKFNVENTPFQGSQKNAKVSINNGNVENKEGCKSIQKVSEIQKSSGSKSLHSDDAYKEIYFSPFAAIKNDEKGENNKNKKNKTFDCKVKNKENEFHHRISSFREYIDCKTKMLLEKCEKWKSICTEGPPEIEGDIDSVIGKTKLLTSDKFLQFKNLIDKCDKGDPLIKVDDLEGFKDWVSIEVEKINEDFEKLEKLKSNNWIPENFSVENSKEPKKKICTNKKVVAKSNIRAHIQAARKMLKNENRHFNFEIDEIKVENDKASTRTLIKNTSESPVENNQTPNSNQFLPLNRKKNNSNLGIIRSSPRNKISNTKNNSPVLKEPGIKNLVKNQVKMQENILYQDCQNSGKKTLKTTPKVLNSLKNHFNFNHDSENLKKGLSEKYFRRPENDDKTPVRVILGEMNSNITPVRMMTRSRCDKYQSLN